MALIVVDASILIALLDSNDGLHSAATKALVAHAADDLSIPASAYSEALVRPARAGRLAEARAVVGSLLLAVAPLTEAIAEEAAVLRARRLGVRLPDALVIATGTSLSADRILTGDARWRHLASSVEVVV
ncbi:MAG: PIN domain-containing protein [Candidatus Dormiibacterota bacterium]